MLAAVTMLVSSASAAELVMYRRQGCPWCLAWDRAIGPIYGKSDIGQRALLRMVDLDRERPTIALKTPVIYTPTFALVERNQEVGRIEGYPGEANFWGLLELLVNRLPLQTVGD
jgi:hypothetical protein